MDHQYQHTPEIVVMSDLEQPSSGRRRWALPPQLRMLAVVLVVATVGTGLLLYSKAAQVDLRTSTDPNIAVIQYTLPHMELPVTDHLAVPETPPFTLYGNGLLICGHPTADPFTLNTKFDPNYLPAQTTSTTLTQAQVKTLIQQISALGFLNLQHSYSKYPVEQRETLLRVSLLAGEHYTLYYGDGTPPAAYTATLNLLKQQCASVTQPYIAGTTTERFKKVITPQTKALAPASSLNSVPAQDVQQEVSQVNSASIKGAPTNATTVRTTNEANKSITPVQAKSTLAGLNGKSQGYVTVSGAAYEVGVDQPLPTVKNQLDADAINNASTGSHSLWSRFADLFMPKKAKAAAIIPVRYVILQGADQPASAGSDLVAKLNSFGPAIHDWYCSPKVVGKCYNYQGVTVVRGSQTVGAYESCPTSYNCEGNQLLATLYNVPLHDNGTIYRTDVDTILIPAWATNTLSLNTCGWSFVGASPGYLNAIDMYTAGQGQASIYCQHGQTLAHETGHTFGLNHTCNGTLMDGSPMCQYAAYCNIDEGLEPLCSLDPSQGAFLASEAQFFSSPPAPPPPLPSYTDTALGDSVTAIANLDGRVEVFGRGVGHDQFHIWQSPGSPSGWSGWYPLGGVVTSKTVAARNSDGRLEIFARGTDNQLWHMWQTTAGGNWSGWWPLGGVLTSNPAVAADANGRLEVFARGTDNALYHIWQTSSGWSSWETMGGIITSDPAIGRDADGRLEVFALGSAHDMFHQWQTTPSGSWSGWNPLGGWFNSNPTVASNADGRLQVFARGGGNAGWTLAQTTPNGGWQGGWTYLGGVLTSDISVGRNADGRLEIFALGSARDLFHQWQSSPGSGFSGWWPLGGFLVNAPTVTTNADGRLEVFAVSSDNALWHIFQTAPNASWSPWYSLSGGLSQPSAITF